MSGPNAICELNLLNTLGVELERLQRQLGRLRLALTPLHTDGAGAELILAEESCQTCVDLWNATRERTEATT